MITAMLNRLYSKKAIAFADWLRTNAQPRSINRNWIYQHKQEMTTAELYERFNRTYIPKP